MAESSGAHPVQRTAKRLRKRLKRSKSVVQAGSLWWRNMAARQPVVGTLPVSVSLTSYGDRLRTVALAIESIGAGTVKPARLILWLDHDTVLPHGKLPQSLRRLQRRGLEIKVAPNVGPHGKYFGYVNSLTYHQVPLVTADDDIMYPRRWLSTLYQGFVLHPGDIHCHWAKQVTLDHGRLNPYKSWPVVADTAPRLTNFALGVSGVIYPPVMLNGLASRGTAFQASCPRADDLWLHWSALQEGIRIRQVRPAAHHFPLIPGTQSGGLLQENVDGGGNDSSISRLYTEGDLEALSKSLTIPVA